MSPPDGTTPITVERVTTPTEEAQVLVGELDAILAAEYPPEQRFGLALEAIFAPNIHFFVARRDGVAAGCCGVALFDDFAEVKRMYVRPQARGRGVADHLLTSIEAAARAAGLTWLRLETGDQQLAALRFYARAGFRPRAVFGAYMAKPPETIANSVFLEKPISAAAG